MKSLEDILYPFLKVYDNLPSFIKLMLAKLYNLIPKKKRLGQAFFDFQMLISETQFDAAEKHFEYQNKCFLETIEAAKKTKFYPKYYASFGGATGASDTTSGRIYLSPTPDSTYKFRVHYNKMPDTLESSNTTNYISMNFPNGLLYCCLAETYGFLKGPADMLTLYEQKYTQEVQKFANEQVGRRRRDDYTDGTVRIPITSANP